MQRSHLLCLVVLVVLSGCSGHEQGLRFFEVDVVHEPVDNRTVLDYNGSAASEIPELQAAVDGTVDQYRRYGVGHDTVAASPRAVERFEQLPSNYIEHRGVVVRVFVLIQD